MNRSTKILLGSWIVLSLIFWYSFSFWESKEIPQVSKTQERVNYEEAEKIANRYLNINRNDDLWKDNHPQLWEATPFFMEKDVPSYIEYMIICEKSPQCWFIVVNIDGDDVDIPVASPSDIPPSQILLRKSWQEKQNLQFYYFGPFDIYSKNKITGQVNAIDPQKDPIDEVGDIKDMNEDEQRNLKHFIWEQKNKLPQVFEKQLDFWKNYKETQDFFKVKNTIHQYDAMSSYDPGVDPIDSYGWKYVKGQSSYNCNSRVPCYRQYSYLYDGWWPCASGCSPVAASIIFGYHDRVGNYPQLIPYEVANDENFRWSPTSVNNMISEMRELMETFCDGGEGTTYRYKIPYAKQYAIERGYTANSGQKTTIIDISVKLIHEINMGRPVLLSINTLDWYNGHSIVWYWYNAYNHNQVRINAGWWNGLHSNSNISLFNITNINGATSTEPQTTSRLTWFTFDSKWE